MFESKEEERVKAERRRQFDPIERCCDVFVVAALALAAVAAVAVCLFPRTAKP